MFILQPKFFENPPKTDTVIPDINPETSFQAVVNFWGQALENFSQEAKECLMSNLRRHFIPLDDTPKKKLLENLLLLIDFVAQNCPEKRILVVTTLDDPIRKCTSGLIAQVLKLIVLITVNDKNIPALLSTTRQNIIIAIIEDWLGQWGINEIHTYNWLMVQASKLGLGIENSFHDDDYLDLGRELALKSYLKSEQALQEDLKKQFTDRCMGFSFFQEFIDVIRQKLIPMGYLGTPKTTMEPGVINFVHEFFNELFKSQLHYPELFITDTETYETHDINWVFVLLQLKNYLCDNEFMLPNPSFKDWTEPLLNFEQDFTEKMTEVICPIFLSDPEQMIPFFSLFHQLGDETLKGLFENWLRVSPNPGGDVLKCFKYQKSDFLIQNLPDLCATMFSKPIKFPRSMQPHSIIACLAQLPSETKATFLSQIPHDGHENLFSVILHRDSGVLNNFLSALDDLPVADLKVLGSADKNPMQLLFKTHQDLKAHFQTEKIKLQLSELPNQLSLLVDFYKKKGVFELMLKELIEDPRMPPLFFFDWDVLSNILKLIQQFDKTIFQQQVMILDQYNNNLLMMAAQSPDDCFVELTQLIQTSVDPEAFQLMFYQTNLRGNNLISLAHTQHLPLICEMIKSFPTFERELILSSLDWKKISFSGDQPRMVAFTSLLKTLDSSALMRFAKKTNKNGVNLFHYAVEKSPLLFNTLLSFKLFTPTQLIELLLFSKDGLGKTCLMLALEHRPMLCETILKTCSLSEENLKSLLFYENQNSDTLWCMAIKARLIENPVVMFYLNHLLLTKSYLQKQLLEKSYENILALSCMSQYIQNAIVALLSETCESIEEPAGFNLAGSMIRCLLKNSQACFFIEKLLLQIPSLKQNFEICLRTYPIDFTVLLSMLSFSPPIYQIFIQSIDREVFKQNLNETNLYYELKITGYAKFTQMVRELGLTKEVCDFVKSLPSPFDDLLKSLEPKQMSFFSPCTGDIGDKRKREPSSPRP